MGLNDQTHEAAHGVEYRLADGVATRANPSASPRTCASMPKPCARHLTRHSPPYAMTTTRSWQRYTDSTNP